MARYQDLPNRIDTITVPIDDQTMCYNYGSTFVCNLQENLGKSKVEVFGTSCSWTVPSGVTTIFIEMWGAGGGGGGSYQCCCCHRAVGGGGGNYISATIPTAGGCVYAICGGVGGATSPYETGAQGATSYVTGYNLNNFCAIGGHGGFSGCNTPQDCFGMNQPNCTGTTHGSSTVLNNVICVCGEGGHSIGGPAQGCRLDSKGGNAAFNGGIGSWNTFNHCCTSGCYTQVGGGFPGGGGAGAIHPADCSYCMCGACGGAGLVRIWF